VAHIDCVNRLNDEDLFDAIYAADIGCSAICISLDPQLSEGGCSLERKQCTLGGKTYNLQVAHNVAIMYDPDVLKFVAYETVGPDGCMPALCVTLEVKGAVSSAAQPAPHTLYLIACSLSHTIESVMIVLRTIEACLLRCAHLVGERDKSTSTSVVIGGNFGRLNAPFIPPLLALRWRALSGQAYQLHVDDELVVLCASFKGTISCTPLHTGARTLVTTFVVPAECYWCDGWVDNPCNIDWIGAPLCDLCRDWHLGHGPFREEADRTRARGAEWDGGPYSPTAADRCAVLLSRWFRARMLPDEPVCGLIADFLVPWYEP